MIVLMMNEETLLCVSENVLISALTLRIIVIFTDQKWIFVSLMEFDPVSRENPLNQILYQSLF